MAPIVPTFHASELPTQVIVLPSGKPRKPALNLDDCAKKEMVQYKCNIHNKKNPIIICEPVVRFYRQCANGLLVETNSWDKSEGKGKHVEGL
ncbi:hypothetical protein K491DRAFT_436961 [Lophiostoma macrostomum CBS 122681]|uniref:Uncharacterized protein n=1 Tax=Lophiostoma macrostomum CBS 122681 TaxID=1314788 RepID=A0A6A6T543_9PLEO|nr:hypothetical protein K491DRAFT_436961 [Lophiostoma macrostomum CBS 122681]